MHHPEIEAFENDVWKFPMVTNESWLEWENQHPELVYTGLGDEWPAGFEAYLAQQQTKPAEFRQLVASVVEIVFASFYGAADPSIRDLRQVLKITADSGVKPPPPTHFLESLFCDGQGWGLKITENVRDKWRYGEC